MPPTEGRAGNICIWVISCLFFLILLSGGGFLVLYITLPETETTAWFPIAGIVLVGIPWVFWIMTCVYRSFTPRTDSAMGTPAPVRAAAVVPVNPKGGGGGGGTPTRADSPTAGGTDSPVDSPGGARRVRFGNATVMGPAETAGGTGDAAGAPRPGADGDSHAASNDSSSHASHESEVPLALSMSS